MRTRLFNVFLAIFVVTAAFTLAGVTKNRMRSVSGSEFVCNTEKQL